MNVAQIIDHACRLAGMEDAPTRAIAGEFLRNRWSTIWNSYLWKTALQAQVFGPDASRERLTLSSPAEFICEVRAGEVPYFPQADADPSGLWFKLEGQDVVLAPPMPAGLSCIVRWKPAAPVLADTSTIPLPGGAECLLAFVTADLYEYMRQVAKSQAKLQEAAALLERMRSIEVAQRTRSVMLVPHESVRWEEPYA
jgi:hypothetical protein